MIEKLFNNKRAPFITVRDGQLHIGEDTFAELTVQIQSAQPVRKLFSERQLKCWSMDCTTGKDGHFCELCSRRSACSLRLQLCLVYRIEAQDTPAILEVPKYSFRAFDRMLEQIGGPDKLPDTLVQVTTVRAESGWTNLEFQALF